jgi:hypothetical protein
VACPAIVPGQAFAPSNVLLNFLAIALMGKRFVDYDFLTITWAIRWRCPSI